MRAGVATDHGVFALSEKLGAISDKHSEETATAITTQR